MLFQGFLHPENIYRNTPKLSFTVAVNPCPSRHQAGCRGGGWEASSSLMQPRLRRNRWAQANKGQEWPRANAHSATLSRHKGTPDTANQEGLSKGGEVRWAHCRVGRGGVWFGKQEGKGTSANEEDIQKEGGKVPKWGDSKQYGPVQALVKVTRKTACKGVKRIWEPSW